MSCVLNLASEYENLAILTSYPDKFVHIRYICQTQLLM